MTTLRTTPTTAPPIPAIVHRLNPLMGRLLRLGLPMGPNVLVSIRGRTTGELRTFPVAILETDGRTLLFSSFGEVNWVRNLRAAGELTIRRRRRERPMVARELSPEEAAPLLRAAVLPAISMPVFGSMLKSWYGVDRDSTDADYLAAARLHPGFELRDARAADGVPAGARTTGPMSSGVHGGVRGVTAEPAGRPAAVSDATGSSPR